jgi:hypothetical protein
LSEHAADFTTLALSARDLHRVVAGRLMSQPGYDSGFSSSLDRDALGSSYGAASDWGSVLSDKFGELDGCCLVPLMKPETRQHSSFKILDVLSLFCLPAFGIGFTAF